jgi:long-chain acyl-CoA synthetase
MEGERYWTRSYDPGLIDIDPQEWETTLVEVFRGAFSRFPGRTALAYMGTHVSFRDLDRYANRFSHMLRSHGLNRGDVVGINLPNIPEYVIAWLGTLRAGCVVSGVSPLLSSEEMGYQLADSRAKAVVTLDAILAGKIAGIAPGLPDLKVIVASSIGGFLPPVTRILGRILKKYPSARVEPLPGRTVYRMEEIIRTDRFRASEPVEDINLDDVAYLQYTGGTTGSPKGAMLSHRNVVSNLIMFDQWLGRKRGEEGIALSGFPFFHIAGLFYNQYCTYVGWTQVLVPNPRDTGHICREMRTYRPRTLTNVPSLYLMLMENPAFRALDFSSLETCFSAASPFPEEAQRRLESIVGQGKLVELYGMTETSPLIACNPYRGEKRLGTVGLPLPNTDMRILDPATKTRVERGQPGEICVKGPHVMVGYLGKPEETDRVFDDDGYFHTGDVGMMDDEGYLRIVDRTKDMIIVGGFKVFSTRVEEVLARHPAIASAALIGVDNPDRPGSELVKAFITLTREYQDKKNDPALRQEILAHARDRLTPYEVPRILEIRQELPLTAVGKVDKKALRREEHEPGGNDRRIQARERVELPCDVRGVSGGERTREKARVINISREGMYVEAEVALDEGTDIDALFTAIRLGDTYWVKGKVLRTTGKCMAIRFGGTNTDEIDGVLTMRK